MKIDVMSYDDNMSDREISLFVHEYVHYLQNITTIYGLERLNYDIAALYRMIEWVRSQNDVEIYVPISEDALSKLTQSNNLIRELTLGENRDIKDFVFISAENIGTIDVDDKRSVDTICINYKNQKGEKDFCTFGANEISESMAYLIERCITKDYETSPVYPYETAQMVIKYIYPELLDDGRNLIILCDKALMSSNPGVELFNIVRWLKQIHYSISTPTELFLFLDYNWELYDLDKKISSYDYFVNRAEDVRNNLHTLLRDNYFKDFNAWVDQVINYAIYLRTNKPLFWLNLVDNGYVKENSTWWEIINNAGSPLIETAKHEYFHVNPIGFDSSCTVYFKVFYQIYKLFVKGDSNCNLMPWCNDERNTAKIDSTCLCCPWIHPEDNGQFCTFRGIWDYWGLGKYNVQKADKMYPKE